MKSTLILVLVAVAGLAPNLSAQRAATSCGEAGGGVVSGVVEYEDARLAERSRGVHLTRDGRPFCFAGTTEGARFAFNDVPEGSYAVHLASLGVYPSEPIAISIAGSDTVSVVISARLEDALAECVSAHPGCAAISSLEPPANLSPEDATEFTYWRAALALAGAGAPFNREWIACLRPTPSAEVLSAVGLLHPEIVPAETCSLDRAGTGRIRHIPSGREARIIAVAVRDTPNGRVLNISYNIASLDARWLTCELALRNGRMEIGRCFTTAVA